MAIHFNCPACNRPIRASEENGGLNGPCPCCRARILIPRMATVIPQEKGDGNGNGNGHADTDIPEILAKAASAQRLQPAVSSQQPDAVNPEGAAPAASRRPVALASPAAPPPCAGAFAAPVVEASRPALPVAEYLKFKCPGCEKLLGFPNAQAGHPAVCPKCQMRVMIPEREGEASFIVGSLADIHKGLPTPRPAAMPVARMHPIRRTAMRLRTAVKEMPWWKTTVLTLGCTAALMVAGLIIASEFRREWAFREQLRHPPVRSEPPVQSPVLRRENPQGEGAAAGPVAGTGQPGAVTTRAPVDLRPVQSADPVDAVLIGARDAEVEAHKPFDPVSLFKDDVKAPSARAVEEEDPLSAVQPTVPLPRVSQTQPPGATAEPANPILHLIDHADGKKEDPQPVDPADAETGRTPEIVGPAAFKPPVNAAAVIPPSVCVDCQGTTFLPLSVYRPYLWNYRESAPDARAAVPCLPCPKCLGQTANVQALVAQEAERMKTAPTLGAEWTKRLNVRLECGETRFVSVIAQLSPATFRSMLQQLDKLTQFLQANFRSALLTQTRPAQHELIIVWDRAAYDALVDLLSKEDPRQDWDLTRRASGSIARNRCFFNAQRGLGVPPEHMALFQFAHMLMLEGTDGKAPDWLTEGFASFCENRILQKNLSYAFRYDVNEVRLGANWNAEIARCARAGQLQSWDRIFQVDLIGMKALDYLTCYSVVRFLASDPARFNVLLVDIRAGMDSPRAIEHAFGRTIEELRAMWAQWALQQR